MRKLHCYCLILLTAMFSLPAYAGDESGKMALPTQEKFYLYLLIGQSNMAGRGKVSEADLKTHPRILTLNQQGEWELAVEPLHFDKPTVVGVGPGREFAVTLLEKLPKDVTIGLIPCAVGGSAISGWAPGGFDKPTKTHPYDDMLKRCQIALPSGTLKGILWHQGESDAAPALAEVYEEKLHELVHRLRKEFGNEQLLFIAGQIGKFAEVPWNAGQQKVDAAHQGLPKKIAQTGFVDAAGLTHKGDRVHFDADSYRELGRRYARKYLELTSEK